MILLDIHESSHDPETESEILVQYSVCNEHLFFGSQNIYSEHLAQASGKLVKLVNIVAILL